MRAERWFHTLVVVGAALPGCSGRSQTTAESDNGVAGASAGSGSATTAGAPSSGAAGGGAGSGGASGSGGMLGGPPASPTDCAYPQSFVCASYEPMSNCSCDPLAPKYMSDCPQPLDFQCRKLEGAGQLQYVGCRCETPDFTPDDCAMPETFRCSVAYPVLSDCHCDGTIVDDADCQPGYSLCCQGQLPRFGCECCSLVIK